MTEFKYRPRKVASTAVKDKIRAMRSKRGPGAHFNSPVQKRLPVFRKSNGWAARACYNGRWFQTQVYASRAEADLGLDKLKMTLAEMAHLGTLPAPKHGMGLEQ